MKINRQISVAPMMDYTDRHDRFFLRLLSPHALLYTEMVTDSALIHGDKQHLLQFDPAEQPLALQLGGSDSRQLAYCAKQGEAFGYDEINLNVGCPSNRVQSGRFGACLMLEPTRVADCVAAMCAVVRLPITVKCRIGVDTEDSYESLTHFIRTVAAGGCSIFIIHARKAWLKGLSPKENRDIPPLRYDVVRQIKQDFPHLTIIVNGGIKTIADIEEKLQWADGVMIGRAAYSNPYILAEIEKKYFTPHQPMPTRFTVMEKFFPYIQAQLNKNIRLSHITRHVLGLFHGEKGANHWRRYLSEKAHGSGADMEVIREALRLVM